LLTIIKVIKVTNQVEGRDLRRAKTRPVMRVTVRQRVTSFHWQVR